ncbi:MAG TPA: hypothetical protein VF392_07270 [Terracidiphilus sp.]
MGITPIPPVTRDSLAEPRRTEAISGSRLAVESAAQAGDENNARKRREQAKAQADDLLLEDEGQPADGSPRRGEKVNYFA